MKTKVFIFAGILALTNASCTDALSDEIKPGKRTVIYANTPGDGTASRSAIDPTQYGGGHVGILWTPGDALGVFGASARNARFDCQATAPAGRAQFAGACDDPTLAYYPYDAANDGREASALSGSLPAVQIYDPATGILEGDYKIGKPRSGADNEFDFTHIFSLLRFNVDATGTAIEGQNLRSVEIALPEGRALAGDFTFSAADGSYTFTGNTTATLKVKWSDTPALESGTTFTAYMSAAPDLHADDEVTITVSTSTHRAVIRKQIAYDFAPNTVYTFNLTLNTFSAAEMTVEEIPAEPEEETANCYMITEAGRHDFKATVIGNGQKGIIPGAGFHTDDASIDPSSAKLLWEDVNGFVTDVELRDGRVYYTTSGNVGNAVIAVYSGSNATGDILWSWHIWGVGDNLPEDVEITNFNGNKYTIMGRNLGDRSDKRAYGVMYQWGRKDPVSSDTIIYVDGVATTTDDPSTQRYRYIDRIEKADAAKATIEYSVRNPMQMSTIVDNDDWLNEENLYLWGNKYFQDEQAKDETGFSDAKTIYDPSPVGYRVANCRTFTYFYKNENGTNGAAGNSRLDRVNYVKYDKGFYFMKGEGDNEGVWFPQNGRRDGYFLNVTTYSGSGSKRIYFTSVGNTAQYWYCNPASPAGGARRAVFFSVYQYKNPNTSVAGTNANNTINVYDIRKRSSLNAVRCVRDVK